MSSGWLAFVWVGMFGLAVIFLGLGAALADAHVLMGITFELKKIDWDAISALATAIATTVALVSAYIAIVAPERQRAEERSEATIEILRASREAVLLYQKAKVNADHAGQSEFTQSAVLAAHLRDTLDRLTNRTMLTDGAIVTGVAAMSLMNAIVDHEAVRRKNIPSSNLARVLPDWLTPSSAVEEIVLDRAQGTAKYAVRSRWPGWEKRFKRIADEGLLGGESQS